MTTAPATTVAPPRDSDEVRITALGVGHGDAVLVQWRHQGEVWTCLVDGGPSPDRLRERLDASGVNRIDLLVLTHLDTDHIGGLQGLVAERPVGGFLGPALPAFERHLWLFGDRGRDAIRRGRALEEALSAAGVDICYPLEGYRTEPFDGAGSVSVLSPPPRLMRRLLTAGDAESLFVGNPMPMGWLLDAEPLSDGDDESPSEVALESALSRGFLEPADVALPSRVPVGSDHGAGELAGAWSAQTGVEPEFFGDSVLNNTSLVLYLALRTGTRMHTVLLPGDQENWTYLLARNPRGLHADVMKASHHGGRVYIESDQAHDELFSAVQPRAVLVSANGRHRLPRAELREAAVRWGSSVVCTCSRGLEYVSGSPGDSVCCHDLYACGEARDVTLVLDANGIRADRPACHSGLGRHPGPIIQIRQHVVDPSPVVHQLAEHELRRHVDWARKALESIHAERMRVAPDFTPGSEPVPVESLATLAREQGRLAMIPHLSDVLRHGSARGAFWCSRPAYSRDALRAYALPPRGDIDAIRRRVRSKTMILFTHRTGALERDAVTLMNVLAVEGLAEFADATLHYPQTMFREAIWPSLAKEFKGRRWHAYLHASGMVAFSKYRNPRELWRAIVRTHLEEVMPGTWRLCVNRDQYPYNAPVLVSGQDRGDSLDVGTQVNAVNVLFLVDRREQPDHWSRMIAADIYPPNRGLWGSDRDLIWGDAVAQQTNGDADRIAELYAPTFEMLW